MEVRMYKQKKVPVVELGFFLCDRTCLNVPWAAWGPDKYHVMEMDSGLVCPSGRGRTNTADYVYLFFSPF